jgi:hypothetical protein
LISFWEGGGGRGWRNNTWEPTTNNMLDICSHDSNQMWILYTKDLLQKNSVDEGQPYLA